MFEIEKTEKDIMNLFGLITAIKSSSENVSVGDDEENVTKHTESVAQLCDIASEKLSSVWATVSDIETEKGLEFSLAEILNHPSIPRELHTAIILSLYDIAEKGGFDALKA